MTNPFPSPDFPTMYCCIGLVRGQYLPSSDAFTKGILLTEDGFKYPAVLLGKLGKFLQDNPRQLNQSHIWSVYPRTRKESLMLFFQLVRVCRPLDEKRQKVIAAGVDYFSIRGVVMFKNDGKLGICIKRNQTPPVGEEKAQRWQPFIIVVNGFLPTAKCNQFWELDCYRDGERLVMEDARMIQDALKHKEKLKENSTTTNTEHSPKSSVFLPSSSIVNAQPKGDTMPTPGKLEVTLKINEFPADAKIVNNGWKQFEIDTGGQIVTVTIKPKAFKKLEQAKENYPQWVAAISGQMGEKTETGFVLKEPNIQVFERKPKEILAEQVEASAVRS